MVRKSMKSLKIYQLKYCKNCNDYKNLDEFYNSFTAIDRKASSCIDCEKIYKKKYRLDNKELFKREKALYYQNNKERLKEKGKKYYLENKDKVLTNHRNNRESINKYRRNKKQSDPYFKLAENLRCRLNIALKSKKWLKNNHLKEYIGCFLEDLKLYLEKQFIIGMNWNNNSTHGWHVDHIIPLSSAQTEEEMYKLCHYTNLQPLWCGDNHKKSNRIE